MQSIADLLNKFKNLGLSERLVKEAAVDVLEKTLGVRLAKEAVKFKNGEVEIKGSATLKSGIFVRKLELLKKLNQSLKGAARVSNLK
jgi:vacuolar-type H+-ATPase subunit B/Vma2